MDGGWKRRLSLLLWPASALIGRFKYAQKFLVVGLVLMLPLGFTAQAYIGLQRAQIATTTREQGGLRYLRSLIVLTGDVVQARRSAVSKGSEAPISLDSDVAQVDAIDRQLGASLGLSPQWSEARRLVLAAEGMRGGAKAGLFQAYQTACDAILALIVNLGDRSSLIHDPDLDSNYLAEMLRYWLPLLCDVSGRIADLMELTSQNMGGDQFEVFMELGKYYGIVSNTGQLISHAADAVAAAASDRQIATGVQRQSRELKVVTSALGDRLALAVAHRSLAEFPSHSADAVRVASNSFASVAVTGLGLLLQRRIEHSVAHIQQIELWAGIGALLAVYLFAGFYLSVASPVRSIVETLRAVAAGDLSRRVRLNTRDELSYVAAVLNETIATTEVASRRLARQASRDTLTDLPNRSVVIDRLQRVLERARRTGQSAAVLFIDLDRFKVVNDSFGHDCGDTVLRTVAERLASVTREADVVARLAGDEFVVISEHLHAAADAVPAAERIVAAISQPIRVAVNGGHRDVRVGASVGIAFVTPEAQISASDLLRDADVAMYRAKERGRSRVEVFDASLSEIIERRGQLEQDLRRAISANELVLHYQPIVETLGGRVAGFEALVRWQHPSRGLLAPGEFIGIAEETGLIVPLGSWVLGEACRQARDWQASRAGAGQLFISVNVSAAQFSHSSFIPTVTAALRASGLDPDSLWLEITETSMHADIEAAAAAMQALRTLGVHFVLDDFGIGYSSLTSLRRLPVEVLKIDRSFVAGMTQNQEDAAIVEMIIGLAKTFDLTVIAAGVETAEQAAELRRMSCTLGQGGLLGRPVPAAAAWPVADWPVEELPLSVN